MVQHCCTANCKNRSRKYSAIDFRQPKPQEKMVPILVIKLGYVAILHQLCNSFGKNGLLSFLIIDWIPNIQLRAQIHQTDIKEIMAKTSHRLCLGQKAALEHTTKTPAHRPLAHTSCACVGGDKTPYQQVEVVCVCHSRATRRLRTIQTVGMVKKHYLTPLSLIQSLLIEKMYDKTYQMPLVMRQRPKIRTDCTIVLEIIE